MIENIQTWLADQNAPEWLQSPSSWLVIGCFLLAIPVIVRLLLKRKRPEQPPESPAAIRRRGNGGVFGSLTDALAGQIPESEKERVEFGQMLRQAGLYSPTARASIYAYRFLFLVFPLICAGILVVFSPPEHTWRILIGGGIIAAILSIVPRLWVYFRRSSRLAQINAGLADMLDMLGMCLGGGMPLSQSLDHVSKNLTSYPALSEELQIMRRQSDLGSMRMALTDWANRIDSPDVRQVATLLSRGDQLGSSMSGSLLAQADHLRSTRKNLANLQANRLPVFLTFPLLFCFAPAALIILMSPAFMELDEFFDPSNTSNPLVNNNRMGTTAIVDTLNALDQNVDTDPGRIAMPTNSPLFQERFRRPQRRQGEQFNYRSANPYVTQEE
ncbi:Bacterial type II secretion system protein F domain protein [Anatilimnocola aggregata]|uniref:Bacterial type II secretion system protein F domain protein n=1 Tax=Anatilimnocola aggregata TaxID=2528021 RepID=A0A517YLD1_9BACT|nr:type II secretion system F family protein [Anatilimnocola aggregata]QDU31036.1 Bacterial type II secretion system protein F domain protein [Anatilimnocola aggregata]